MQRYANSEIPAYKKLSDRDNKLATDDGCHVSPRGDLNPRRLRAWAIDLKVVAPSSLIEPRLALASEQALQRFRSMRPAPKSPLEPNFEDCLRSPPPAFFAASAAFVRSDIRRRSFSAEPHISAA